MVVNKRKKNTRMRATRSHGYGSHKKHRGHGHRGGSGLGGTGKRADSKKPSFWHDVYFGKFGFERNVTLRPCAATNIKDIELNLENYIAQKLATKEGEVVVVDIGKLGFQKLLGDGRATKKYRITTKFASGIAIDKIKKAGGEVITTIKKKEKKPKTEPNKKQKPEPENKPASKKAGKPDDDSEE